MSAISLPHLWIPRRSFAPVCRNCGKAKRQTIRDKRSWWRRLIDPLSTYSAGDVLLDSSGNVILDSSGNVMLSDGSGNSCCCGCPDCASATLPSSVLLSGWETTIDSNGCGFFTSTSGDSIEDSPNECTHTIISWDGTLYADGSSSSTNTCDSALGHVINYSPDYSLSTLGNSYKATFLDGTTTFNIWVGDHYGVLITCGTMHSGTPEWNLHFGGRICASNSVGEFGFEYYKTLGSSLLGTYTLYSSSSSCFSSSGPVIAPSTMTVS